MNNDNQIKIIALYSSLYIFALLTLSGRQRFQSNWRPNIARFRFVRNSTGNIVLANAAFGFIRANSYFFYEFCKLNGVTFETLSFFRMALSAFRMAPRKSIQLLIGVQLLRLINGSPASNKLEVLTLITVSFAYQD